MANASLRTSDTLVAPEEPLNLIVAHYPGALAVFQRFGLDTCCGGALPLCTAVAHHGLDLDTVLAALNDAIGVPPR